MCLLVGLCSDKLQYQRLHSATFLSHEPGSQPVGVMDGHSLVQLTDPTVVLWHQHLGHRGRGQPGCLVPALMVQFRSNRSLLLTAHWPEGPA